VPTIKSEVYFNRNDLEVVGEDWIGFLKDRARQSPLRRSRLCLHRGHDDPVQQMIIVMCQDVLFRPHRHLAKSESFHMIEGLLDLILFDMDGNPEQAVHMGPIGSGLNFCHRLNISQFHAVLPLTDFVVMHEITAGPWIKEEAEFAPWAPEQSEALRAFLENAAGTAAPLTHGPIPASMRKTKVGTIR
jgi:cupin fold WbuC family metalloprotein